MRKSEQFDLSDDLQFGNTEKTGLKKPVPLYYLVFFIVIAILVCIAVGLGVYFGTKTSNPTQTTMKVSVSTVASNPTAQPTICPSSLRLPTDLYPNAYHLWLKPYLPSPGLTYPSSKNFTFDANVTINFTCMSPTTKIIVNGDRLTLNESSFTLVDANNQVISLISPGMQYNNLTQMYTFNLNTTLQSGMSYTMTIITYTGILGNDLKGFYFSTYMENGQQQWMAVTQFQPTDARRAFPCFDEPSFKATFTVSITHATSMHALSNGKETLETNLGNGWTVTNFEPSKKMSSYLLAFAVCAFNYTEAYADTEQHTRFRIWARPSLISQTEWALYSGPKVLQFYENYFNITFPLDKQDLLAVPELSFGAMENWGLVTYREYELLYDPTIYPASYKELVAEIIAHELAHQWFGDLVTMSWWDDLWLNEGFASWMTYRGADEIGNYTFDSKDQFTTEETMVAMSLDQLSSSHPVFQPVAAPNEINQLFDAISYDKGASVLNMLNHSMGPQNFKQGLHNYLNKFKYSNAKHQDLWSSLQQVATANRVMGWNSQLLNITSFMNKWILQMGFPVLNVQWNPATSSVNVSQARFLVGNNSTDTPSIYGYQWYVPVFYYKTSNTTGMQWLTPSNTAKNPLMIKDLVAFSSSNSWILINPQVYGYYRLNYDAKTWAALLSQLMTNPTAIDVRSRAKILDDTMALARANMLSYPAAMNFTKFLQMDFSYISWSAGRSVLSYIGSMLALTPNYGYYEKYVLKLALPIYQKVTWNDQSVPDSNVLNHKLRALIIQLLCRQSNSDCVKQAQVLFNAYRANCTSGPSSSTCNKISPNLRSAVYCAAVSSGGSTEWEFLWSKYQAEPVGIERISLLYGLSCPRQPWLINRLLNAVIKGQVRRSEARYVYVNLPSNNQVAMEIMWNYVAQNWDMLVSLFGTNLFSLRRLITASTSFLNTESQYDMISTFIKTHNNLGTAQSAFQQSLGIIRSNIQWMKQNSDAVVTWLAQNSS